MTNLSQSNNKVIGIVGGMGPLAGLTLCKYITYFTDAVFDQQHLSTILMSMPGFISDRTLYLEGKVQNNPAYGIIEVIEKLEKVGAEIIGIACNTSHSPGIYDIVLKELQKKESQVKIVHMPIETCRYLKDNYLSCRRVGLMTTNGTYKTMLYKNILEELEYEVVLPDYEFQHNVIHRIIYDPVFGLKSNSKSIKKEVWYLIDKALSYFARKNTDAIILGCTELSIVFSEKQVQDIQIIDSSECLAKALIRIATSLEKNDLDKQILENRQFYI